MSNPTFRLVAALVRRTLRQNAWSLLLMPGGFVLICAAFVVLAKDFPQILTGPTAHSLDAMARLYAGSSGDLASVRAWSALFLQVPYLVTFLGSTYVVSLLSSSLIAETHKGGIEMLLAEPFRPRQIVAALFWNSLAISSAVWLAVVMLWIAAGAVLMRYFGLGAPVGAGIGIALMLPLAGMLWSAQIVLALHLLWPRLSSVRVGSAWALTHYLATLPAVLAFLVITFRPELDPVRIAAIFLAVGALGAALVTSVLACAFRPSSLLEST